MTLYARFRVRLAKMTYRFVKALYYAVVERTPIIAINQVETIIRFSGVQGGLDFLNEELRGSGMVAMDPRSLEFQNARETLMAGTQEKPWLNN